MSDALMEDADRSELAEKIQRYRHLLPPILPEMQARMDDAGVASEGVAGGGEAPPSGEAPPEVPAWPRLGAEAALDRAEGCLLGLAIGDAMGASVETLRRGEFPTVAGPFGGGPLRLAPGEWTDATATALCLADSLLDFETVDLEDFAYRLEAWLERGENTASGRRFDTDPATRPAVARFLATGNAAVAGPGGAAGVTGSGALARVAPLAIFGAHDPEATLGLAARQSRATHPDVRSTDSCRLFAAQLMDALTGASMEQVLRPRVMALCPSVLFVCGGEWEAGPGEHFTGDGDVVRTLEAALWAVWKGRTFRDAVRLAASLGGNASGVAAVTGQLAGALHGASAIPTKWVAGVARQREISLVATELAQMRLAAA